MSFLEVIKNYNWEEEKKNIYSKNKIDVEMALGKERRDIEDFKALISPAATTYLEQMARLSNQLTLKRFGKTVQLYIPLYLSNECTNSCVYCGFNHKNKINRLTLSKEQVLKEVEVIKSFGHEHILLVTGEHPKKSGVDYLAEIIELIKPYFSLISAEVQPMDISDYEKLIQVGLHTVYIYQETYNHQKYKTYHPAGKKADYNYRVETPDRLGQAGIRRIGLGTLIGLEDWRTEAFYTALHLKYLEKNYWKTKYSVSFPRLRPHAGTFEPNIVMTDRELVQLICAYRIFDEDLELSVSTRESEEFRNNIIKLGVTSLSAGSKTDPGGYASGLQALEQFQVHDVRTPAEIEQMIHTQGYEAVWKDWDLCIQA